MFQDEACKQLKCYCGVNSVIALFLERLLKHDVCKVVSTTLTIITTLNLIIYAVIVGLVTTYSLFSLYGPQCYIVPARKRTNQEFLPNPNRTYDFFCRTEPNWPKPAEPRTERNRTEILVAS